MRGGRLNRIITLQTNDPSQSSSGEVTLSWTNVTVRRHAKYRAVRGDEQSTTPEKVAYGQVAWTIRYSDNVSELTPNSRVIYPALTEAEAADPGHVIPHNHIFDVLAISEVDDGAGLELLTQNRSDVTP